MRRRTVAAAGLLVGAAAAVGYFATRRPPPLVLTGTVMTDEVTVGAETQGRLQQVLVREGDAVKRGELLAVIRPQEQEADMAFYTHSEQQARAQVTQAEADLTFQEAQTSNQVRQAQANLAAAQAQQAQGRADRENARLSFDRERELYHQGVDAAQAYDQARTAYAAAQARVDALHEQVRAARAALALARAGADQIAVRRAALEATRHQLAAAAAQKQKAGVRLDYTGIRAPINGIVDVRAALPGEVVSPGQAIVTLIDPDNLWVRADVEEGLIDRIHLGQTLTVRLPSGVERCGAVFYRGVDADYATQRDVSRTKRDIKTFEIRLRCDNSDRSLAMGMTAYVVLPGKP